jgi:MFS family permease
VSGAARVPGALRARGEVRVPGELRRARASVSVVFGVCGAAFATWAARVPAAQHRLGLTPGQLAIALFGLAAGSVIALAVSGALITRLGSRAGAAAGAAVLCLGLPLAALAGSLPFFVAALVALGVGNGLLDVSMNAHAARVERAYGRPVFAGFHAFWNIGGLAGSGIAAAAAARHVSVAVEFPVTGAVLLALGLAAIFAGFLRGADEGQGGAGFAWPGRVLLTLGVVAFCGFVAEGTVNDWSAVYLSGSAGAPAAVASLGYFAFSVAMIGVRLIADRLVARIGAARLTGLAGGVAVAGYALVIAVPDPAAGLAGFAVVGLGVAPIVPLAWSAAGRRQPDAPGRAIAGVATLGYLGFLLGPVLIGGLAGLAGLRLALVAAAVAAGAVCFLAPALAEPVSPRAAARRRSRP